MEKAGGKAEDGASLHADEREKGGAAKRVVNEGRQIKGVV